MELSNAPISKVLQKKSAAFVSFGYSNRIIKWTSFKWFQFSGSQCQAIEKKVCAQQAKYKTSKPAS